MAKQNVSIEGLKKDEALTVLIQSGLTFKEAEAYWKQNRPTSTGFAANFYAVLESGTMSYDDFDTMISLGSKNVQNHRSHYNAIREMANAIWAQK